MLVKEPDLMTAEHLQDVALVRTLSERRGAASSGVTPDRRIVQEILTPEKEPEWMTNAAAAAFDVLPIDISVQLGNDKDDSDDEDPYAAKAAAEQVKGKDGIGDDDQHAAKTAAGKAEDVKSTEYNKFVGALLRDPLFMHGQSAKNRFSGAVGAWKASHPSASKQKPQAAAPKKKLQAVTVASAPSAQTYGCSKCRTSAGGCKDCNPTKKQAWLQRTAQVKDAPKPKRSKKQ